MFEILFTSSAIEDLRALRKSEQTAIIGRIDNQLSHEPNVATRNRKRLRPNQVAEWELRIGAYRVFYDVFEAQAVVKVEAIGYKEHDRLIIRGEEFEL
jgi:mRNA-degrading endonuclease RelE of RelBE toxin-antitoxin system